MNAFLFLFSLLFPAHVKHAGRCNHDNNRNAHMRLEGTV